mmetsp:Transcript_2983/g.6855  ORF Transcript_2983/g.6855 Transcript_2983/m.6855 type:complete len:153 (+) Transcript_2983:180-638(+)
MGDEVEWKLGELDSRVKNEMREVMEKLKFLEKDNNSLRRKIEDHDDELRNTRRKMASLQASSNSLESTSHDVRRVEWTIPGIRDRMKAQDKGMSIWSPEFSARGINGIQLEFFSERAGEHDDFRVLLAVLVVPVGHENQVPAGCGEAHARAG